MEKSTVIFGYLAAIGHDEAMVEYVIAIGVSEEVLLKIDWKVVNATVRGM